MIQFTSVTLLYSFASSLGDFQVWFWFDSMLLPLTGRRQFLYIDLFIIIPVAVTSKCIIPIGDKYF